MQKNIKTNSAQRGFTLVELSIVLVIIGLIVGGVLVGQSLIAAAKVRAQMTQLDQYDAALNAFRAKYDCLPGDCASAPSNQASGTGTVLGDGNITYNATWIATLESAVVWPQMAGQGMIGGTYTPVALASFPGTSIPTAKLGGYVMIGGAAGTNYYILTSYTTGSMTTAPVIGADASQAIDSKRDDGQPLTGVVTAIAANTDPIGSALVTPAAAPACVLTATTIYNVTNGANALCTLRVRASG